MKFLGKSFLVVAFMVSLLFVVGNAGAAIIFGIDLPNEQLKVSTYPGPYATVRVDLTNQVGGFYTGANITLTSISPFKFGDGNAFALNISDNPVLVTSSISTDSQNTFYQVSPPPSNVDGFKYFNFVLEQGSMSKPATTLSFSLTGSWANEGSFFLPFIAGQQYPAAVHVWTPTLNSSGEYITGWASASGGTDTPYVPVPPTVWLLGAGLVGLWGVRRRFFKK